MRVLFLVTSITIALLSILFREALVETITSLFEYNNTTIPTFKGLPLLPPIRIYGAPKSANMTIPRAIRKAFLAIEQVGLSPGR
jgi:hypothetical protein